MKTQDHELVQIHGGIDGSYLMERVNVPFPRLCELFGSPEVVTFTTGDGKVDVEWTLKDLISGNKLSLWNWKTSGRVEDIRTFSAFGTCPDFLKQIKDLIEDPSTLILQDPQTGNRTLIREADLWDLPERIKRKLDTGEQFFILDTGDNF